MYPVARIIIPPENSTVCNGDDVTVSCGFQGDESLPVTWIINGCSYSEPALERRSYYHVNNRSNPMYHSLTIDSNSRTKTIQCSICLRQKNSTLGTVTVVGM